MSRLANPPILLTDITTNVYFSEAVNDGTGYRKRYINADDGIWDAVVIPRSFEQTGFIGGLVAGNILSGDVSTFSAIHMHQRALATDYKRGWNYVNESAFGTYRGNFGEGRAEIALAAQREGNGVYLLQHVSTEYAETTRVAALTRPEFVDTIYQKGFYLSDFGPAFRVNYDSDFFVSDDENPFFWAVEGVNTGVATTVGFVADGTDLGVTRMDYDHTDQNPYSALYGVYVSPGSGFHSSGTCSNFRQKYPFPRGVAGYGPFLSFPWRCGTYGAPELFFYVPEYDSNGYTTGRIKIFRSEWKRGAWKRYDNPRPDKPLSYQTQIAYYTGYQTGYPVTVPGGPAVYNFHPDRSRSFEEIPYIIDDDPAYNAGPHAPNGTRFPKGNPAGFAFDHRWYKTTNHVGTVGPFPVPLYNISGTAAAVKQNAELVKRFQDSQGANNFFMPKWFKFMRDHKRRGVVHLVAQNQQVEYGYQGLYPGGGLDQVFTCSSGNDGRSWGSIKKIRPYPRGFNDTHFVENVSACERHTAVHPVDGGILVNLGVHVTYNPAVNEPYNPAKQEQTGTRGAFMVADYSDGAASNAESNNIYYKRGENTSLSWL